MKNKERIIGVDIIKSFACVFVIFLHTSVSAFSRNGAILENTIPSQVIYYLGTGAVPLFFMANAFFIINRPEINYRYIFKKIIAILVPVILWNTLLFIGHILEGRRTSYIYSILGSLIQKGFFFQFWFLGSLILLLLFAPIFNRILKNCSKLYICIFILSCLVCYVLDIANHIFFKNPIQSNVIQTFRIWSWFSYYLLGGLIGHIYRTNRGFLSNKYIPLATLLLTVISVIYSILNVNLIHNLYAEFNYDNFLIMIWITAIFISVLSVKNLSRKNSNMIELISSNNMGIYIVHVPILKIFNHFILINSFTTNLIAIVFVFGGSLILSYCLSRIPWVSYLVKL